MQRTEDKNPVETDRIAGVVVTEEHASFAVVARHADGRMQVLPGTQVRFCTPHARYGTEAAGITDSDFEKVVRWYLDKWGITRVAMPINGNRRRDSIRAVRKLISGVVPVHVVDRAKIAMHGAVHRLPQDAWRREPVEAAACVLSPRTNMGCKAVTREAVNL